MAALTAILVGLALLLPAHAFAKDSYRLDSTKAIAIAKRDPRVIEEQRVHGQLVPSAQQKPPSAWDVGFYKGGRELVLVVVDDTTGTVTESWTGYQVAWSMARGYSGAFGRKVNAPYVWLPLCAFFVLGLLDWRRLRRIVHLDLLVLLGFSVSLFFFNRANIGVSVPLVYPVMVYLLGRMLWIGFRGRGEGLRPSIPIGWLALGTVFLLAFRVALNLADANVIDVGYSGVIGADRVTHDKPIYGEGAFPKDNASGDTYGPANYYAYVPFELAFPWSGTWDDLPAAHAAAVAFDLIAAAGLFFLGRRIRPGPRGRDLGVVLAYAWAAYPFTAYALESNSNDTLVAVLIIGALLLINSPVGRATMVAAAAMTKFAPIALAPLFAAGVRDPEPGYVARTGPRRWLAAPRPRPAVLFSLAFVAVTALLLAGPAVDPGLATFWERTITFQAHRNSPFSIWGQTNLDWLHTAVEALAVGLAIAVAFVPARRSFRQIAALGAAVMIAVELTADHWFYLYVVWFFPLVALALTLGDPSPEERPEPRTQAREPVAADV